MNNEKKRLIIIDSNSIIHRAFHALPPLTTKKGELVNAVYGFLLVFFKTIREFQPDYIAACFDFPGPTFRHAKFKEYKAKRPPAPKELYEQIPKIKEILKVFNVSIFEKEGFEADDLIGTISKKFPTPHQKFGGGPKVQTIILSGDLDTLQLVDKQTGVCFLKSGVKEIVLYDEEKIRERYQGLNPEQLLEFKALIGDPSDNIPGIIGIGEKTAIELIRKFGSLENLYQSLEKIKSKLKEKLIQVKEQVFFNKTLVGIKTNVPIDFNLKKIQWKGYNKEEAERALRELEFYSLLEKLPVKEMKLF